MPHHIYTTPGFLVHSSPSSEAGKFFLVFTRDLGMVGAVATGVRLSKSKLRYYTQDYSYSLFSLVRGKEVWRMTGAKEIEGVGEIKKENQKLWVQILVLLKRLLQGEDANEHLFEVLESFYTYLTHEAKEIEALEHLVVLRVLDCLGYISNKNVFERLLNSSEINDEILNETGAFKDVILKEINNGLKQSQL